MSTVGFADYDGALLRLAIDLAERLMPAFDTPTGVPYGTVNLRHGVPKGEIDVTCTAGGGTFLIEFGVLSRLTGDDRYELAARRAALSLMALRSARGLVGNHVNITSGEWVVADAGIGHGVDSFYEYLAKAAALFQNPEYEILFRHARVGVEQLLSRGRGFYVESHLSTTQITWSVFNALQAFWPGVLVQRGRLREAAAIVRANHDVWLAYDGMPEKARLVGGAVVNDQEGYYLRPEHAESIYHLSRASGASQSGEWQRMAADIVDTIERRCKVDCGYAALKNVLTGKQCDRMDSFWLAETLKYLYLTFADDSHWLHARPYAFNTEAHVFPYDIAHRSQQRRWAIPKKTTARVAVVDGADRTWLAYGQRPASRARGSAASTPMRDNLLEGADVPINAWVIVDIPSPNGGSPLSFRASTAQFGPPLELAGVCGAVKWMTAPDGCKLEFVSTALVGTIAVATRGGCTFAAKAVHASAAGAVGLIVVDNNDNNEALFMAPLERSHNLARSTVRMPSVLVPRQAGVQLVHLLNTSALARDYKPNGDPHIDSVDWRINARVCLRRVPPQCSSWDKCAFAVNRATLARMAQLRDDEVRPLLGTPYNALLQSAYDPEQHKRGYWEHAFDLYSNASSRQQCAALLLASELTETVVPTVAPTLAGIIHTILGSPKASTADDVKATTDTTTATATPKQQTQPASAPPPPPPPPPPPRAPPASAPVPPGIAVADPLPPGEATLVVDGVVMRNQVVPILIGVASTEPSDDEFCVRRTASMAGTTSLGVQCEEGEFAQTGGCRGSSALFANHPHSTNIWVCEQMIPGVVQAIVLCCVPPEFEVVEQEGVDGVADDEF
jgi:hypothetical protein